MTEFKKEPRYYVIKIKDAQNYLTKDQQFALRLMGDHVNAMRQSAGRGVFNAVVVEQDWPEFDLVWDMIESRMTKGQNHPEDDSLIEDIKLRMDMADGGEDSDPVEAAFFAIILARIRRLEAEKKLLKEKLAAGTGEYQAVGEWVASKYHHYPLIEWGKGYTAEIGTTLFVKKTGEKS